MQLLLFLYFANENPFRIYCLKLFGRHDTQNIDFIKFKYRISINESQLRILLPLKQNNYL